MPIQRYACRARTEADPKGPALARYRDRVFEVEGARRVQLVAARQSSDWRNFKKAARTYLCDLDVRRAAAFRALGSDATIEGVDDLLARIDPFTAHAEQIVVRCKPKTFGYRQICELPLPLLAAHHIIAAVILAASDPAPFDFHRRGSGRDDLIQQAVGAALNGLEWCLVGDIKDCFPTVEAQAFYNSLPLPRNVIRHCLDCRNLTFVHATDCICHGRTRRNDPKGLIQGSPASNPILSRLFSDMPTGELPTGSFAGVYSDNVLIMTRTEEDCSKAETTLRDYFAAHPSGSFHLKALRASISEGVENLGYALQMIDDRVAVQPSHSGYEKLCKAATAEEESAEAHLKALTKFLNSVSGFKLWNEETEFIDCVISELRSYWERWTFIEENLKERRRASGN